ncbi:50S ribosomal protein L16 [Candidatus Shikimatogenerans bostrichidophilus]|uniref:50S ribosomal protein L16 n=1 Tax=Candidatus Shikimatogenerans bostrichidophilus TaxID=2943807 RepID=UPI00296607C9
MAKKKYLKQQKGRIKGFAKRGYKLHFGKYGIQSIDKQKYITEKQIEAARVAATRYMKREGKLYINIFTYKPITKKPQEVRMGKGKGNVEYNVAVVKPGRILFEINGVSENIAKEALRLCAQKLPVKTKYIIYDDYFKY